MFLNCMTCNVNLQSQLQTDSCHITTVLGKPSWNIKVNKNYLVSLGDV